MSLHQSASSPFFDQMFDQKIFVKKKKEKHGWKEAERRPRDAAVCRDSLRIEASIYHKYGDGVWLSQHWVQATRCHKLLSSEKRSHVASCSLPDAARLRAG